MPDLLDYLPETIQDFKRHLAEDQARWGDTWKQRPREGQEERVMARILDYFDQYRNAGTPIPWLKIIGLAHICLVRESHPDYGETP